VKKLGKRKRGHIRNGDGRHRHEKHHGGHFIIPESLGGTKTRENVYTPWAKHEHPKHVAWHTLFGNSLPSEAISLVRFWTRKDGQLDMRFFTKPNGERNGRAKAWKILFDDLTPAEAIAWIEREFVRKEWLQDK